MLNQMSSYEDQKKEFEPFVGCSCRDGEENFLNPVRNERNMNGWKAPMLHENTEEFSTDFQNQQRNERPEYPWISEETVEQAEQNEMGEIPMRTNLENREKNSSVNEKLSNVPEELIQTIISGYPRPNEVCKFCNGKTERIGTFRMFHAAAGYPSLVIYVDEILLNNALGFSEITTYENIPAGKHQFTIMAENGYLYLQKQLEIRTGIQMTLAIISTSQGLELQEIVDSGCRKADTMSCIRAVNLARNSGALTVTIGNQAAKFQNLRYRAVSEFAMIRPGIYLYAVTRNVTAQLLGLPGNILVTAALAIQKNRNLTMYLLNWNAGSGNGVRVLIVEDL